MTGEDMTSNEIGQINSCELADKINFCDILLHCSTRSTQPSGELDLFAKDMLAMEILVNSELGVKMDSHVCACGEQNSGRGVGKYLSWLNAGGGGGGGAHR